MLVKTRAWIIHLALLLLMFSCVPTAQIKRAEDLERSGALKDAYSEYMKILQKNPNNKQCIQRLIEISDKICGNTLKRVQPLLQDPASYTVPKLQQAMNLVQATLPYDYGSTRLRNVQTKIQEALAKLNAKVNALEIRAADAIARKDFQTAKEAIATIKRIDPASQRLAFLDEKYLNAFASTLEEQILDLISANRFLKSQELIKEWRQLPLASARKTAFEKKILKHMSIQVNKVVKRLVRQKKYYTAYLKVKNSGLKDVADDLLPDIRAKGGRFYLRQAQLRLQRGNPCRAYLEAVKGYELNPKLPGMFEIYRDTRDMVLKKMQKYVAIPTFGAPKDEPDLGSQFSDALISYLFRTLPYGINIVEREKIDLLIQEHKRELKTVAHLLNVDLIISGNVSLMKVDKQKTENLVTVRAKVGEKAILNPEYERWLTLPSDAKHDTRPPAKLIAMPEYQTITYKKGRVKLEGRATVAVRIFDTHKGAIVYAQEFNATFTTSDKYQDAVEIAGISEDLLELPTELEVREKLRNNLVRQVAKVINTQFEKRERAFLTEAKYYLSRRENKKAIDSLAQGFLYCVKSKVGANDKDFVKIRDLILELTEGSFL